MSKRTLKTPMMSKKPKIAKMMASAASTSADAVEAVPAQTQPAQATIDVAASTPNLLIVHNPTKEHVS